jgi:hypothetical protein
MKCNRNLFKMKRRILTYSPLFNEVELNTMESDDIKHIYNSLFLPLQLKIKFVNRNKLYQKN